MKILYGLEQPDSGTIRLRGEEIKIHSTHDAEAHGIGMVHQHFCLFDSFTGADNIVMVKEPRKGLFFYDREASIKKVEELSEKYKLQVDPRMKVGNLSVGEKQRVEILRILYRGSTILILDEPTSLLTQQEIKIFFEILLQLKSMGYTIILITHKLEEVCEISDRTTVMRNGEVINCCPTCECTKDSLARMMVGKEVMLAVDKEHKKPGKPILETVNLSLNDPQNPNPVLNNVNLTVREGEIYGIAGVAGNGLGDLENVLTGMNLRGKPTGKMLVNGHDLLHHDTHHLRSKGLSYVPSDRLERGTSMELNVADNLIVVDHENMLNFGILQKNKITKFVTNLINKFNIRGKHDLRIGHLSGGKRLAEGIFVHNPAACAVDQHHPLFHLFKGFPVDQAQGFLGFGHMDADIVGLPVEIL
jgi:simple sugar transport system ATP-binding protein